MYSFKQKFTAHQTPRGDLLIAEFWLKKIIVPVCYDSHTNAISQLFVQKAEFLIFKQMAHAVTTDLKG
jgi:hypothetical protein